jgi:hypothetical protein
VPRLVVYLHLGLIRVENVVVGSISSISVGAINVVYNAKPPESSLSVIVEAATRDKAFVPPTAAMIEKATIS